MKLRSSSRPRW